MFDGYLAAFNFGLVVGAVAILFGALVRSVDSVLNPFNWSLDDHWS